MMSLSHFQSMIFLFIYLFLVYKSLKKKNIKKKTLEYSKEGVPLLGSVLVTLVNKAAT